MKYQIKYVLMTPDFLIADLWVTLKGFCGFCTPLVYLLVYPLKIQTRTDYRKRIKEQDSRLKKQETIANQCTKNLRTSTNEN